MKEIKSSKTRQIINYLREVKTWKPINIIADNVGIKLGTAFSQEITRIMKQPDFYLNNGEILIYKFIGRNKLFKLANRLSDKQEIMEFLDFIKENTNYPFNIYKLNVYSLYIQPFKVLQRELESYEL